MFDRTQLKKYLEEGWIRVQKHPNHPLFIYNYTQTTQFEGYWNDITLSCRGLILDEQGRVVARPFRKFFNLGESTHQVIPNEPFEVFEKMDGSLGILYWHAGQPFIASRGSFSSKQAVEANRMLYGQYRDAIGRLDISKTYLFEIIYPANRIVVDYGQKRQLVLLAVINTQTGQEAPLEDLGFPVVKRYQGIDDLDQLLTLQEKNREGFVIRFAGGLRYKVKFAEYVHIHRLVTQVSSVSVWENLKTGQPVEELIEKLPDEFYHWVKETRSELWLAYQAIEETCQRDFRTFATRKETANYFMECSYPNVLFKMLDGKPYADTIWRMVRPEFHTPFSSDEDKVFS